MVQIISAGAIKATGKYVLVELVPPPGMEGGGNCSKLASGLYLPPEATEYPNIGYVCSIGPRIKGYFPDGCRVVFGRFLRNERTRFWWQGIEILVAHENDLLLTIEE